MVFSRQHHIFFFFLISCFFLFQSTLAKALPVFYSTTSPPIERQNALRSALSERGIEVTVFGRYRDFFEQLSRDSADVVIGPPWFGDFNPNYENVLVLVNNGKSETSYVLLKLGSSANIRLQDARVGLVQAVDLGQVDRLLASILGHSVQEVRTVNRPEDLVPLLVFGAVDVVMMSQEDYQALKGRFTTELTKVKQIEGVSLPQVFVRKGSSSEALVDALTKVSTDVWRTFGVSGVRRLIRNGGTD
jgi:hypothetical protein